MALWDPNYDEFLLDPWTALDYKSILATKNKDGVPWMAPDWMGADRRRIQGYTSLAAYRENTARLLRSIFSTDDDERRERRETRDSTREYGDSNLLIEQIKAALLGDEQTIVVAGADKYSPDAKTNEPSAQAAAERQEELQEWAEKERFLTKLLETELNAITFGDAGLSLGWDYRRRPILRTWDPSNYFPVLDDDSDSEYPRRVHLAWELRDEDTPTGKTHIHKITYWLREVEPYRVPWEDEPVTLACFMTEAIWTIEKNSRSIDDLTNATAQYIVDEDGERKDRNLGIDFIPFVHIPNTVAEQDHFGKSSLLKVLQLLDDISETDSDLKASAGLTGSPMLATSGTNEVKNLAMKPGTTVHLGQNGSAEMLSGADGMTALREYLDHLRKLLSTNARVPEAVLGRVDPGEVAAGVVLSLSFGPLKSMIEEMRLVRRDKYRLLFKMVQRFYLLEGEWNDVLEADLVFGSYLPTDQQGVVNLVVQLYGAKLISLRTAHKMLQEVGIPITDPGQEEADINRRDFAGASELLDASGNEDAVGEYLGIEITKPEPPTIITPNQVPPVSDPALEPDPDNE